MWSVLQTPRNFQDEISCIVLNLLKFVSIDSIELEGTECIQR